jgi:hypothetical protein
MLRSRLILSLLTLLVVAGLVLAVDPPTPLLTASGTIAKMDKDSLTIKPRGPDGKFGKDLQLTLTGTSKFTTLTSQHRSGKLVIVQKDTEAKDLQAKQSITIIYTMGPAGPVLLSAIVQAAEK